jgi:hypothetical protein
MNLQLPSVPESFKSKSFWNRPEGNTGLFALALVVVGGGIALSAALPFIITLLSNLITAGILFGAVALGIWAVTNKSFRWLVSNMFKSAMRAITGLWTTVDPIGILENYVDDLKKSVSNMSAQIENLAKNLQALYLEIKRNESLREQSLRTGAEAKKRGASIAVAVEAKKANRKGQANIALTDLAKKMELLLRVLRKFYEIALANIDDLSDEVDVQKRQRKMILAASAAFRSGMKAINQGGFDREMFDRAMDYLVQDYGQRIGEITNFVEMSGGFLQTVDIQNAVCEEQFLQQIEEWEKKGESMLLGADEKSLMVAQANSDAFIPESFLSQPLPEMETVRANRKSGQSSSAGGFLGLIK